MQQQIAIVPEQMKPTCQHHPSEKEPVKLDGPYTANWVDFYACGLENALFADLREDEKVNAFYQAMEDGEAASQRAFEMREKRLRRANWVIRRQSKQ